MQRNRASVHSPYPPLANELYRQLSDTFRRAPLRFILHSSMASLTTAITSLGFALLEASLRTLPADDSGTGVFFSPVSVYYALTLALNGAGAA